jgi:predicted phage tail protein
MNKVILYGALAATFGSSFDLDVRDPAEAYRALECQLPGFRRMCLEGDYYMARQLKDGSFAMTEDMLKMGMSNTTLHFLPNIDGAADAKAVGKMVVGVGLIAASFFIPGSQLVLGLALKTLALSSGLALALGGAALLIAPTPKVGKEADNTNSFIFNGDSSAAAQGFAVPVTYGLDRVKAIPIATQISTNEYHVRSGFTFSNLPSGGFLGGIFGQERTYSA